MLASLHRLPELKSLYYSSTIKKFYVTQCFTHLLPTADYTGLGDFGHQMIQCYFMVGGSTSCVWVLHQLFHEACCMGIIHLYIYIYIYIYMLSEEV